MYDLFNTFVASFAFLCFLFCFSFFLWVGSFSPSPLTSGGPPQCLNSGPFEGMLVIYLIFVSFFRCVLGLFPFIRLKATHCPGQYLFWGHSSAFYYTGSPSLCWPLASSGSSGIPTWFSRPRPLAFLRPEPLQGWQYSWQVLRLAEPDLELIVWGSRPFGNYTGRGSRRTFLQAFQGKFQRKSLRF